MFSSLFVCFLPTLRKNFQRDLHEILREGWQWANEQTIRLNFDGDSDLLDSSLLRDTEIGIN